MISGELVTLRARRPGDEEHAARWYDDPETTRWLLNDAGPYEIPAGMTTFADARFTVDDTATGTPIGTAGLVNASPEHRRATAFLVIGDAAFRGRGYGFDTMRTLCRFAFDSMNLAKVELEVLAGNDRAVALYERVGFVREVHRRRALWVEGEWHDEYLMGLFREELR
ncbi:MAG TPA: GNAT family protein [Frankiaceae bacterium]|nr:GNAT family protein [Frankiaceae bacterium]